MIENHIGPITKVSRLYETKAWGVEDQPDFLNQALICNSLLSAKEILDNIHHIEEKMGRIRNEKWAARVLDIDIIFYGDNIIKTQALEIPHPQMTNRNFVLVPLMDICPLKKHPLLNMTIKDLKEKCADQLKVIAIDNPNEDGTFTNDLLKN